MRWLARWRPALRIARRDAWTHKGRSAVVLLMVALPVLVVVAGDTLARTAAVSDTEGLDRRLGAAAARVSWPGIDHPLVQGPSGQDYGTLPAQAQAQTAALPRPTARTITAALGPGTSVTAVDEGSVLVRTADGLARTGGLETALRSSVVSGLFRLSSGRLPRTTGEVAVTSRLAGRALGAGSRLRLASGATRSVVGVVESTTSRHDVAVYGLPGSLGLDAAGSPDEAPAQRSWLVDRPGGVSWADVRTLNAHGLLVLSRSVVTHPPPEAAVPEMVRDRSTAGSGRLTVIALIAAMALLEVVLLAGPAFAVGTRRQERSLALVVAAGGGPRDVRRTVLGGGVVLGGVAAVVGSLGGVAAARLTQPLAQRRSTTLFGPFDLSLRDIAAIAACGFLSAVVAALVPAMLAASQDVVAVLASRRGQARPGYRFPAVGVVMLAAGIALAAYGARGTGGENAIVLAAIVAVVGMVLVVPLVVAQLGRLARGFLPLAARFALRDAARHRRRTAPAVAAVAATVAGVVALGIGVSSDSAEARATYTPGGPAGAAVVRANPDTTPGHWGRLARVARAKLPGARVRRVQGYAESHIGSGADLATTVIQVTALSTSKEPDEYSSMSTLGSSLLVGGRSLDMLGLEVPAEERAAAQRVLAQGGVAVLTYLYDERDITRARLTLTTNRDTDGEQVGRPRTVTVPAVALHVGGVTMPAQAVLSEGVLRDLGGVRAATTALLVDGETITGARQASLEDALASVDPDATVAVERGYHDNTTAVAILVLSAVGAVLLVGGTLTATFLALSDARPDFATLGAVGAAPRTRRAVAAAYAGVIGLVGGALGAAVGFVPGIAVTYPLTGLSWLPPGSTDTAGVPLPDHFVDVPWLLVGGLVVVLPLATAAVVGLAARSRLPMVSRMS